MGMLYREDWKNKLNHKRGIVIGLINRLMEIASEKNYIDINKKYQYMINYLSGNVDIKEQKCFFCGHSINQHDFSHTSECRAKGCDCDEFIFETRKCVLCDKLVDRNCLSDLMLNPHMQLIPLCDEHFEYQLKKDDV